MKQNSLKSMKHKTKIFSLVVLTGSYNEQNMDAQSLAQE
jgi:hypothetical protein